MVCQITGLASHQNVFEDAHSYATCMQHLISFHKKDGFKVEKCQSFVKVTKLYSSFISWNFPLVSEVNYFVSAEKYKLHTAYSRTTVCHKTSAKEILTVGNYFNQSQNSKQ